MHRDSMEGGVLKVKLDLSCEIGKMKGDCSKDLSTW
jgi:hypothetical protein